MTLPTAQDVRELFDYEPATGVLTWRKTRRGKSRPGGIAGTMTGRGYLRVALRGKTYAVHRLAWVHFHGKWPMQQLDHINGVRDDNRIVNLREATGSQNQHNRGMRATNNSGYKGVHWEKHSKKWRACIWVNSQRIHLGRYDTAQEAGAAYRAAALGVHGEFAKPM